MDHGQTSFVLVLAQPTPGDLADLGQFRTVAWLIAAVVDIERRFRGVAHLADQGKQQVLDLLERRQENNAGQVQMEDHPVLNTRGLCDNAKRLPVQYIETVAGAVPPIGV
jgi:hypothetical protein